MPSNPQELTGARTGDRFARWLAVFYASTFLALGVHLPFLPVWLAAKGLDARTIGLALALPMVLRLFAIPMAARAADRRDALKAVIVVAATAALAGFGALGLSNGVVAIVALYSVAATAYFPLFVLSDVYALRGLADRRTYGLVRIWGSAAFIVANLGAGLLTEVIAARDLIWLVAAGMGLCAVTAWTLPPLAPRPPNAAGTIPRAGALLRDPAFLVVGLAVSLIQASHGLYYGFSTIAWGAAGYGGGTIGLLWGLGVVAEIAMFAASARLPAAIGPGILILAGAGGALIRWSAMALDPPAAALPLLQCLHGLSFGATHLGTLGFIARAAPAGLAATAQGYLAVSTGLAIAGATALSGLLYGRYGAAAYAAMAVIAAVALVAAFAASRMENAAGR